MSQFQSFRSYEKFIYTLQQYFPSVKRSSLILIKRGKHVGQLRGEMVFGYGFRVTVNERLSEEDKGVEIISYGYELWHNTEKIAWYDSQPHPHDPTLASTHPHHKHVPPNIKRNRIPAPNMSFECPNLPALMAEIEELIQAIEF
ncbi:MAG: hypothetical protein B6242_12825 [Anaerolineaceae bacterium 4572_78]|nr:MAG: hypothetical protein B6242_12825 [Anaerolineaceae bacterium 4572_78]